MPFSSPRIFSCSIAAGRRVSREAISTLRLSRVVKRLAIFAVVVVLPEPCRPTIMMATGGGAFRSIGTASSPSVATSSSWTIFTTIWPGVTERTISAPTAFSRMRSTNAGRLPAPRRLPAARGGSRAARRRRPRPTARRAGSDGRICHSGGRSDYRTSILAFLSTDRPKNQRETHPRANIAGGWWPPGSGPGRRVSLIAQDRWTPLPNPSAPTGQYCSRGRAWRRAASVATCHGRARLRSVIGAPTDPAARERSRHACRAFALARDRPPDGRQGAHRFRRADRYLRGRRRARHRVRSGHPGAQPRPRRPR